MKKFDQHYIQGVDAWFLLDLYICWDEYIRFIYRLSIKVLFTSGCLVYICREVAKSPITPKVINRHHKFIPLTTACP